MMKNKTPRPNLFHVCFFSLLGLLMPSIVKAQLPTTFQKVDLVTGLKNSVSFEFAPDGRIFIIDRYGQILIYKPATQTTVIGGFLDVFHDMEEGLLAVAFDPQFNTNHYIYVHYSHPTLPRNRVSRFVMNGDQISLSSEVVLLEWANDRNGYFHAAGDMDFDSQGNLYIAIGDNTNHTTYSPLNETDPNQSAERTSSNTNDLRGKILRIKPNPDGTYSIPSGNLFPNGVGGRPEIYVMGARNPYKIFVDKTNTDWLFWGEVGPDANAPSDKGPEGLDEINLVKSAGNYGWPYVSGKNRPYLNTYAQPNFYYDHANPVNISKWNTGAINLPPAQPAWLDFFHGCYLAGPRYYFNSSINNARKLPSQFHQGLFYFDFNTSNVWVVHFDGNGNIQSNQRFAENVITGTGFIDMEIGPDGQLYILEYGAGCCPSNVGSGKLVRVDYTGVDANFAPVVNVSANPVSGPLPLTVNFSSQGTVDQDGDALTYEWDFQSDGTVDSNQPNPSFTFTQAGVFSALLRVTDSKGAVVGKSILVYPGNNAANITFNFPPDGGMISWDDNIQYQLTVSDVEDGNTTNGSINCSDVNLVPAFGHLTHAHDGITINQCSGSFHLDPTSHDAQGQDDIYYVFKANYTDNNGLTSFGQITVHPKLMEAEFFDAQNNTTVIGNSDPLGGGRSSVRALSDNSYIMFDGRNLQNISSVSYRVATTLGGVIEVHADSPTGTLLSSANIPITGALDRWTNVTAPIANPGGKHDLYFVFKKPGSINILDLNFVEFIGAGVSTDPTPPNVYSMEVMSRSRLTVRFNEALNEASAETKSNYSINNGITISSATLDEDKKTVHLVTSPFTVGTSYELTINGVRNMSNVAMTTPLVQPFTMDNAQVRINSGGGFLVLDGVTWKADAYFQGGAIDSKPNQSINNTIYDVLYQTDLVGNFSYNIPLPDPGTYNVKLHFAEKVYKNAGARIFNVNVENGQGTLNNFDIWAKTGYAYAYVESFNGVLVNDGFLNIVFSGVKNNPILSGIEVYYANESAAGPSLTITNPSNNLTLPQPFQVTFNVQNQWVGTGGYRIIKMVDGVATGSVFSTDPITFDGLPPGPHTIKLVLADAAGQPTAVSDEVVVNAAASTACIDNPFPLSWQQHVLGPDLPYRSPHILAADIDNDGYKDIVTGAWWFRNPGTPTGFWTRNVTGAPMNNMFLIYDLDRDGDPDILGTQGTYLSSQLAWAKNDGKGNFTIYTNIPESAGFPPGTANNNTFLAGVAVGNFNNVPNIQIAIVWNGSETTKAPVKMLTVPVDPSSQTWTVTDIAPNAVGETITAKDIDNDGDLDLCQAKNWLRNDNGVWTTINTTLTMPTYYEHHAINDLDRDGVLDGVMTQIGDNQEIFWFKVAANPTQPWTKTILGTDVDGGLSLDLADLDFDGDLDVITGEWKLEKRLLAFENDLCNSGTWIKHVLHPGGSTGPDHHNGTQTADLDNDGDLDIISLGWDKRTPRIYINNSSTVIDNHAPVLANPIPDQPAAGGTAFSYTFPSNTFTDEDGDQLIYTASLTGGGVLPSWLKFTGTSRTFSGTPPTGGSASISLKLSAYDGKGGNAQDEFLIIFPNLPPVVANPIPNQTSLGDTTFNFTFAANTFTDPNGDGLTYSATLSNGNPLPAWITFIGSTRTFTANPTATDAGVYSISVTASDSLLTVSDVFNYTVLDPLVNQPPLVANPIADMNATVGAQFNFTFPSNTFSDANGDNLTYTATRANDTPLPAWLTFHPDTRSFNGIPGLDDTGTLNIKVTANDGKATVSDNFSLTIDLPGSIRLNCGGPSLSAYGVTFSEDQYSVNGGVFSNNNITDITGTVDDQLYKTERFNVFSYEVPVPSGNYKVRLHFAEIYFGATGGGAGAVGKRVFNVTAEGQPLLTNFDIYAEVGPMAAVIKEFNVSVVDGTLNLNFVKVVENPKVNAIEIIPNLAPVNSAPLIANPIADQSFPSGSPLTFTFATNTFTDPDGDVLTYSAALSNGSPLPSWLTFNSTTRTFSGTPSAAEDGIYQIRVTATDNSLSVSDVFDMTIGTPGNQLPVVNNPISDQSAVVGTLFTFAFPSNTFSDPDANPLTYTATLDDNNPLPAWLTFDGATRTFSGTPASDNTGAVSIKVTASDGTDQVSDTFVLTVSGPGSAAIRINSGGPQLNAYSQLFDADKNFFGGSTYTNSNIVDIAGTTDDQLYRTERSGLFSYAVPVASGTYLVRLHFAEIYYSAPGGGSGGIGMRVFNVTAEGQPLLTNFDIFAEVGSMRALIKDFQVTVTDGTLNLNFARVVRNPKVSAIEILSGSVLPNQTPVVANAILDQSATAGVPFNFTIPLNTFSDPDNDPLAYTATLIGGAPLPSWLSFNPSTRAFSGTPAATDAGNISVVVTASDGKGGAVTDSFVLTTGTANGPPVVSNPILDQVATVGIPYSFTFATNTFSDPGNDPLTYTATLSNDSPLPAWITFDAPSRTFSGTPGSGDTGSVQIKVTANDGGATISDTFVLTVSPPGSQTVRINSGGPQLSAYSAVFDADKNFFGGSTYTNSKIADIAGTTEDQLYRTERSGLFSYAVPVSPGTYLVRLHFAEIYYSATGGGSGGTGMRVFNVTAEGQPLLTNFDIFAEVGSMRAVIKEFQVSVSDGTLNLNFTRVVRNPKVSAIEILSTTTTSENNQPPVVANAIPDQSATTGSPFNYVLPANTFTDGDGDLLTYTASRSSGAPLPSWLSFTASTGTFSGTPGSADAGNYIILVTASDGNGGITTDSFILAVEAANSPPVIANAIPDQNATVGTAFNFTFALNTFSDANSDPLTYTATLDGGAPLPSWLTFTGSTRTFSGTPVSAGNITIHVTASDGNGGSVTDSFTLTLGNGNSPPSVANVIPDQNATVGTAFNFTFALNTFTDPNGDALTYSASGTGGSPLPFWLSFSPSTRTFSGTPAASDAGNVTIEVTAQDPSGANVIETFLMTVSEPGGGAPAGIRINSGGGSFTSSTSGAAFSADANFSGGGTFTTSSTVDIAGTTDDFIYRSERFSVNNYSIPVAPGTYQLTLHFAEIWFGAPGGSAGGVGSRVFNVLAEGNPLLINFDIYAVAGGPMIAVVRQFEVNVTDGFLTIAFTKITQNAKISAIEVVPLSTSPSARMTGGGNNQAGFIQTEEETRQLIAYPNPFHRTTTVEYTPTETEDISLQIVSPQGSVVGQLFSGEVTGGTTYSFDVDGSQLSSGFYFVHLKGRGKSKILRLSLVRMN